MTFTGLSSTDYHRIARAEAIRRIAAAKARRDISADQRRRDGQIWSAIVGRAGHFLGDRPALPFANEDMDATAVMAATVLRTTHAALNKWRDNGRPTGEPEARAFLLFSLAQKFAELTGSPRPCVDSKGAIYFPGQKQTELAA